MRNEDIESLPLAWDDNSLCVCVCVCVCSHMSLCWDLGGTADVVGISHRNYRDRWWQTAAMGPACY